MSYESKAFDGKIVELLKNGGVGVLPSDTIYGLSCRALDEQAVEKLRRLKGKDDSAPLIVLISKLGHLKDLNIPAAEAAPALRYWPGKLSLECQAPDAPAWLHRGGGFFAVRWPDYHQLGKLIDKVGPIVSTSANPKGAKPAATISQAKEYFADALDFYVDAGDLEGKPSTLVKPVSGKLRQIRPGAVKIRQEDQL